VAEGCSAEVGCSKASLLNWERGRAEPELRFLPAILRFLGYDPRQEPECGFRRPATHSEAKAATLPERGGEQGSWWIEVAALRPANGL
jgi:hypothetical protein